MADTFEDDLARVGQALQAAATAPTASFLDLARGAGVDPATGFKGANLAGVDLRGAKLADIDLTDTELQGADLTGADLSRARMSGSDLSGANLQGATLVGADLTGARLVMTHIEGADFAEARIDGADFADTSGAAQNLALPGPTAAAAPPPPPPPRSRPTTPRELADEVLPDLLLLDQDPGLKTRGKAAMDELLGLSEAELRTYPLKQGPALSVRVLAAVRYAWKRQRADILRDWVKLGDRAAMAVSKGSSEHFHMRIAEACLMLRRGEIDLADNVIQGLRALKTAQSPPRVAKLSLLRAVVHLRAGRVDESRAELAEIAEFGTGDAGPLAARLRQDLDALPEPPK